MMALYDHRVFNSGDGWWAAEVHGGSGFAFGEVIPEISLESAIFTKLIDEKVQSRMASIPAGTLNRMSHKSIVRLLESAQPLSTRMEMNAYNTPDEREFHGLPIERDDENLRWVIRQKRIAIPAAATWQPDLLVEVRCLDDSALRRDLLLEFKGGSGTERDDLIMGIEVPELIAMVKATFAD